jgi:branched-chain amino acid transport system ATP-binding protein
MNNLISSIGNKINSDATDDCSTDLLPDAILKLCRVNAYYGKYQALFDLSLSVESGEVLAVTGLNGAGKTTLTRVISGLIHPSSGCIFFKGINISGLRIEKIQAMGLELIPDRTAVFNSISVVENLKIFFRNVPKSESISELIEKSFEMFPRLKLRAENLAGQLSGGEQRMLSLAKPLIFPPEFLIVDEISLGLAPKILAEIWEKIDEIKKRGTTMLIVEQYIKDVKHLTTNILKLENGKLVA